MGLLLAACLLAPRAHAEGPKAPTTPRPGEAPDPQARARELYREGSEAFESGDNARAVRLLREAWALRKTYDVAGTLAQAELELGLFRDAAEHLEFCVRNFPLHESQEESDSVRAELDRLRARLSRVQLRVVPDGAEVLVNGRVVGRSPLELPVYLEPGTHTLGARMAGRSTERPLKTEAGLEQSVELRLDTSSKAAAPADPPRTEPSASAEGPNYTPAVALGGVALAAVLTGVGFTLAANADNRARERRLHGLTGQDPCGAGRPEEYAADCRKIDELADSSRTYRVISYGSFGMALAAGAAALLLWPSTKDTRPGISLVPGASDARFRFSSISVQASVAASF
jgi:hypothetical protein